MKDKKWKWNYYIIVFIAYLAVLFFIDLYLEGSVAEYFVRTILEDREQVTLINGVHSIRGSFRWDRLKDILSFIAFANFLFLELAIYISSKISRNKEKNKILDKVEKRMQLFQENENPKEDQELKVIDVEIKEILNEKSRIEQDMEIEIQKKNDLVTYLAHDLKTPLTSIIGYLNILEESEVSEEIRKDYLKKVLDKAYHLEELTNQFFDIARFNLQEIPLKKTDFDGAFFLQQITEELYPLLIPKNLDINLNVTSNFRIYGDGNLLARVLNNLFKNAISYSNNNSIIKITGKQEERETIITVENEGDIISNQELELIFKKFYRRDKARNQSAGAGLGLAIAKEIIQRHNGTLNAESVNGHTTFIIHLPQSL